MSLVSVKNLSVSFQTAGGVVQALRKVSFDLNKGESLGLVGESGSGKSVTSLAIMDLLSPNASRSGEIFLQGKRGKDIAMIFQDPMSSLNPCFTVEYQLGEVLKEHLSLDKNQIRHRSIELLQQVGIPDPQSRLKSYPHELSGGMSQRVMIAMAIACHPQVLIADEPTTALDVTIQKQILQLLNQLRKKNNMSLILISHDLGVIAQNTDRMMVMYAGEVVESGVSKDVIRQPSHPYTEGLLKSLPSMYTQVKSGFRLPTIPGVVLNLLQRPSGCQFAQRCSYKVTDCEKQDILFKSLTDRQVRCALR